MRLASVGLFNTACHEGRQYTDTPCVVNRIDLVSVVRGEVLADHGQRIRIGIVDDRAFARLRGLADVDFFDGLDVAERGDEADKFRAPVQK